MVEIIFSPALWSDNERGQAQTNCSIEAAPYTHGRMGIFKATLHNISAFQMPVPRQKAMPITKTPSIATHAKTGIPHSGLSSS